jgi:prevent-host-death family protein
MATLTVSLTEARNNWAEIVDRARVDHEPVVLTRRGKPVAEVASTEDQAKLRKSAATQSIIEARFAEEIQKYAAKHNLTDDAAVVELVKRGIDSAATPGEEPETPHHRFWIDEDGWPTFSTGKPITSEEVKEMLDQFEMDDLKLHLIPGYNLSKDSEKQ